MVAASLGTRILWSKIGRPSSTRRSRLQVKVSGTCRLPRSTLFAVGENQHSRTWQETASDALRGMQAETHSFSAPFNQENQIAI